VDGTSGGEGFQDDHKERRKGVAVIGGCLDVTLRGFRENLVGDGPVGIGRLLNDTVAFGEDVDKGGGWLAMVEAEVACPGVKRDNAGFPARWCPYRL